jgi:hypothetical protein
MMTPQTLGCALYQQVLEFTPLALEESGQDVTVGMNYVIDNLDPIFKGPPRVKNLFFFQSTQSY